MMADDEISSLRRGASVNEYHSCALGTITGGFGGHLLWNAFEKLASWLFETKRCVSPCSPLIVSGILVNGLFAMSSILRF